MRNIHKKIKNKFNIKISSKKLTKIFVVMIVLILGYIGFTNNLQYSKSNLGVHEDNEMLQFFQEQFPNNEVLKIGLGDVNDDGREDLVVIFKRTYEDSNEMRVVFNNKSGYKISSGHNAPYENQTIEFLDIDNKPPTEFLISGSKNGNYGYSIYRLVEYYEVESVFGDNMGAC